MIPLDQPIRLTFSTFSDTAETVPADPTTVTLEILLPDQTVVTKTWAASEVVKDSTGVFHYDYTPTTAGHYAYHWHSTGTVATALDGTFDVRAKYDPALVSLSDVKAHLNITSTTNDDEIQGFIDAATEVIENITGPILAKAVTEWHDGGSYTILLTGYPVTSVTSITEYTPTAQVLAAEPTDTTDPFTDYGYVIDTAKGEIARTSGGAPTTFLGRVKVVYTAGRSTIPANVRLAALKLVKHMWSDQRGGSGLPLNAPGDEFLAPTAHLIPWEVEELLAPYKQGPKVA